MEKLILEAHETMIYLGSMEMWIIRKSKSHKDHLVLFRLEHLRNLAAQVCETPVNNWEKTFSLKGDANNTSLGTHIHRQPTHICTCVHILAHVIWKHLESFSVPFLPIQISQITEHLDTFSQLNTPVVLCHYFSTTQLALLYLFFYPVLSLKTLKGAPVLLISNYRRRDPNPLSQYREEEIPYFLY